MYNRSSLENSWDKKIWKTIKGLKEEQLLSGYDIFPILLRYPLSKVLGRTKRLELGSDDEKMFEYQSLLEFQYRNTAPFVDASIYSNSENIEEKRLLSKIKKALKLKKKARIPHNKIFVPIYSERIEKVCAKLSEKEVLIIGEKESPINFKHIFFPYKEKVKKYKTDKSKIQGVYNRLEKYLTDEGYILDAFSRVVLYNSISKIYKDIQYVLELNAQLSPKLILLLKDTYSPSQAFALLSHKQGVKTILLQHGLDCETYFLDDIYTENAIVWGNYRKDRYEKDSKYKAKISVLGNPNFDQIKRVYLKKSNGKNWLLITRPHHSQFCYSYSRKVKEGLDILKTVSGLSKKYDAKLGIKPHSNDFVELYKTHVDLHDDLNVKILSGDLDNALEDTDLVISEDSSAIIDAMLKGKLIIMVDFADSEPTLPVKFFDVVPLARNEEELDCAIKKVLTLDEEELRSLQEKQDEFIEYCVGPINMDSTAKTVEKIYQIMHST